LKAIQLAVNVHISYRVNVSRFIPAKTVTSPVY